MDLTTLSTEDLKKELANRGYAIESLWQIADVDLFLLNHPEYNDPEYVLQTDADKLEFMNDILASDGVMGDIQDHFSIVADMRAED